MLSATESSVYAAVVLPKHRRILRPLAELMGQWPPPTYPKVWCNAVGTGLAIELILLTAAHIAGRPLGMVALFPATWFVVSGALGSFILLVERHSDRPPESPPSPDG
jgi:drug/metabolite transporter (DMT)-like permease